MRPIQRILLVSRRQRRPLLHSTALALTTRGAAFGCVALVGLLLAAAILAGGALYAGVTADLPALERLPILLTPDTGLLQQPTRLYDRTGRHLLYSLENPGVPRRPLSLDPDQPDHFSPLLVQMIVAVDDPGFWAHPGVTRENLFNPQPATLAERLVDHLLLDQEPPGWRRVFRMRLLAVQATARFGRPQMLEWYLNNAYFGHLAYGAESAARLYLNKSARDLNLAEVALLIAAEEAPALNPLDAPAAALERQRMVLDRLLDAGQINDADYLRARTLALQLSTPLTSAAQPANAFAALVLDRLERRFGRERLERGGLRILTTLDYELQLELNCTARQQAARLAGANLSIKRLDGADCLAALRLPALRLGAAASPDVQVSAAVLDVQSGQVLAYLGDTGLDGEQTISSGHAPGSLLSPFVALAGFARGISPASLVWDISENLPEGLPAAPIYRGPLRLRFALANDYLTPVAQMMRQIGSGAVLRSAEALGVRGLTREAQSEALLYAGGKVSLLDLAQAYSVFARMGELTGEYATASAPLEPLLVRSVQSNDGEIWLDEQPAQTVPVLSAPLAYLVHDILRDSSARQPSLGFPSPLDLGKPAAAKTGSANGGQDVWTVGYTPQRLAITWVGQSNASLDVRAAAGLWYALIEEATRALPELDWNVPAGINHMDVCDPSGKLPTPACPNVVSEVFLAGSEPHDADALYRAYQINRETGRLATVFTPPAQIVERVYLAPPPEAEAWARAAGIEQPPQSYDSIQPPAVSSDVRIDAPALFAAVRGKVSILGVARGEGFQSYRLQVGQGLNPQTWMQVDNSGGQSVSPGGELGVWDTQGLDGLYALRLQVLRSDNRIETATIQVTVDNAAPQARVLYPAAAALLEAHAGELVTLQAAATDNIQVTRVEWVIDGLVVEQRHAPFSLPWQAAIGRHRLQVRAYDQAGNVGVSEEIEFAVR